MVKVVFVKKNGSLKNSNIKIDNLDQLYKKCLFSSNNNFDHRNMWCSTDNNNNNCFYSIFAKNKGKAGTENKYELPPPIDSKLYFGTMIILKHSKKIYDIDNLQDLTLDEWKTVYEKKFGGFEDIDDDEEESPEEYVDPENLTKEGYDKTDGFIVDDDESISLDSDSDEDEYNSEGDEDYEDEGGDEEDNEDYEDEDYEDENEDYEDEDEEDYEDEDEEDYEDEDYEDDEKDYLSYESYSDESDDE